MILPRFSVRELLGFVAFLAVGTTALLYASALWASLLFSLALLLLLVAALGAIVLPGSTRAFWLGIAVFGWLYFLMINWPGQSNVAGQLVTNDALRLLYDEVLPRIRTTPEEQLSGVRFRQRRWTIRTYDQDDPF